MQSSVANQHNTVTFFDQSFHWRYQTFEKIPRNFCKPLHSLRALSSCISRLAKKPSDLVTQLGLTY